MKSVDDCPREIEKNQKKVGKECYHVCQFAKIMEIVMLCLADEEKSGKRNYKPWICK